MHENINYSVTKLTKLNTLNTLKCNSTRRIPSTLTFMAIHTNTHLLMIITLTTYPHSQFYEEEDSTNNSANAPPTSQPVNQSTVLLNQPFTCLTTHAKIHLKKK